MKDKRQRMALVWPYVMYSDPNLTATLFAYQHPGLIPNPALGHSPYPLYASRFSSYPIPASSTQYPHPPHHHHHPSLLQQHPTGLPLFHHQALPPKFSQGPVYRQSLPHRNCSSSHSEASSDCESTPTAINLNNNFDESRIKKEVEEYTVKGSPSPPFKYPLSFRNSTPTYSTSPSSAKTPTKLFQPYKNDVPERAKG